MHKTEYFMSNSAGIQIDKNDPGPSFDNIRSGTCKSRTAVIPSINARESIRSRYHVCPAWGPKYYNIKPWLSENRTKTILSIFWIHAFFSFFSTDKLFIVTYGAGAGKKKFSPYRLLPSNIIGSLQQFLVSAVALLWKYRWVWLARVVISDRATLLS